MRQLETRRNKPGSSPMVTDFLYLGATVFYSIVLGCLELNRVWHGHTAGRNAVDYDVTAQYCIFSSTTYVAPF